MVTPKNFWDSATAKAMAKLRTSDDMRRDSTTIAMARLKTGDNVTNETVKRMITPTPQETVLGILREDKIKLLKSYKESNPLFGPESRIEYFLGLQMLYSDLYLSRMAKMKALQEGREIPEKQAKQQKDIDTDTRRLLYLGNELGIFQFGREPDTVVNIQQNQLTIEQNQVDIRQFINQAVDKFKFLKEGK